MVVMLHTPYIVTNSHFFATFWNK